MNQNNHSALELMQMYQYSISELERRAIIRRIGNLVSDYTIWLATNRMGMELTHTKGYDAQASNGRKVKIISFRNSINNQSSLIGVISDHELKFFDELLVVIYTFDFNVNLALIIPKEIILETNLFSRKLNGYALRINNLLTKNPNILDISHILCEQTESTFFNEDRIIKKIESDLKIVGKRTFVNYYEYLKKHVETELIVNVMLSNNLDWKAMTAYTKVKKMKLIFDEKNENKALEIIVNSTNKLIPQSTKDRARELLEQNENNIEYA